jgi:hypothetical protein
MTAVDADAPTDAISQFYALVSVHQFGAAEELWSAHMRSRFPPDENIVSRFRDTHTIGLRRAEVVAESQARATVAVDVVETDARTLTRRFIGRWHLVRAHTGWLLDAPELRPAP